MNTNNNKLFELLRQRRNEIAKEAGVKPYMVLHNSVLVEIAEKKPTTVEELAEIKGMGKKKLERYSNFILETINESPATPKPKIDEKKVYSVSEFIDFINELLVPNQAIVQGEISQFNPRDGYAFFTLIDKDEEAALNCFVWQRKLDSFGVELKEGLELKVAGLPKIFKRSGRFNFEVEHIGLVGEGALKQALEALKKELAKEGYFEPERKKPLPKYVQRVGLITSAYGDAKSDFLTHLGKFGFEINFCDVRVEGIYAVDEITSAIRWFNENMGDIQALVLTRGGGSLESLQPFNSKAMAKAIFASKIPIITAIGHEKNETIADLVADVYASTPTDAARVLSDPWRQAADLLTSCETNIASVLKGEYTNTRDRLASFESNLVSAVSKALSFKKEGLVSLQRALILSFHRIIDKIKSTEKDFINNWEKLRTQILTLGQSVDNQESVLYKEVSRWFRVLQESLGNIEQKLKLSDPTGRLRQGYSIIFNSDDKVIKSSKQIEIDEEILLKFYEGEATGRVEKKKP
ncbi:MAG: exodeoxyribonuclease VII large subunit [Patescibacteria group bacterium]